MELSNAQLRYPRAVNLVGVNHRTLSIEQREYFARLGATPDEALSRVARECRISEGAVLATCNRFEVLSVGEDSEQRLVSFFESVIPSAAAQGAIYVLRDRAAVSHLFEVSAGLDSLALGEPQIAGQVKGAYELSVAAGLAGKYLHALFQFAFRVSKRVRSGSAVGERGISISFVAVKLAQQIFTDLARCQVVILGSGRMAELTALHLHGHGARKMTVLNRTVDRAVDLASRIGGSALALSELDIALQSADLIIGSLLTDRAIIDAARMRAVPRHGPLFLIDLGMPRNFSPALSELEDLYLYNIDDLAAIADENRALREESAKDAKIIVEHGVLQFEKWVRKIIDEPRLLDLRATIRSLCEREVRSALRGDLPAERLNAVSERVAHALSQRVAHEITEIIRALPGVGGQQSGDALTEKLLPFILDELLKAE